MSRELRPSKDGRFPRIMNAATPAWLGEVALGNYTQYRVGLIFLFGSIFVAVEGKGAYEFSVHVEAGYLSEKLNIRNLNDAANFADFVNSQFGVDFTPQGTYPYSDLVR